MMARKVMAGASGFSILSPNHPNLLAMYTMDNISGATLFDETANSHDGTISGATAVAGHIDNALSADGVNDSVLLPVAMLQASKSISIWMRVTSTDILRTMTATTSESGSSIFEVALVGNGVMALVVDSPGDILLTTSTFATDTWHHAVFQTTGSLIEIWANGVEETIVVNTGSNTGRWVQDLLVTPNRSNMFLRNNGVTFTYTPGLQDQTRVFDRLLTASEIGELYNGGAGA